MSDSMQVLSSANAGVTQSKFSTPGNAENTASVDDPAGFNAVFASYIETDPDAVEQQVDENLAELLNQLMPQELQVDGNSLPENEKIAILQALFAVQPAEITVAKQPAEIMAANLPTAQLQNISLMDRQRKPDMNPVLVNQDYFNTLAMQNKEGNALLPVGFAKNNSGTSVLSAQLNPLTTNINEALLQNMSDQQTSPVMGSNTTLSQSLAAVGFGTATQASTTQTQMAPLNLGQNAWETNLGSRLQMMVGGNVQTAEIRLDPPELGALDIKIKITNDIASVHITSPHAQVRDALENAVPKLREMFEESGVALGDVNVGQESFAQQENTREDAVKTVNQLTEAERVDDEIPDNRVIVKNSLLDIYA